MIQYLIKNGALNQITVLEKGILAQACKQNPGTLCDNKESTEFAGEVSSALLMFGLGFAAGHGFQ